MARIKIAEAPPMSSVASRIAHSIVTEYKITSTADNLEGFVLEMSRLRNEYSTTCQKILIFLVITLVGLASYIFYGHKEFEIAATKIQLDDDAVFFGFLLGNIMYVLQIGAFFKVLVAEKVLNWCWDMEYSRLTRHRIFLSHNSQIGYSIGHVLRARSLWERFISWYIMNFFLLAYSIFFYVVLGTFIEHLLVRGLKFTWTSKFMFHAEITDLSKLTYAVVLVGINVVSTAISIWLMRDLRPRSKFRPCEDEAERS